MATRQTGRVVHHLRRAALLRDGAGLTDGQLLECFLHRHDEAAFEAIVRRHGPMVMGVCRRLLRHDQDAEDAFQATFLVLVRKAAAIASRELLANWLYGVAVNTARKARAAAAKRRGRERQVIDMPEPYAQPPDPWDDLQPLLDQELSRLPDKYRVPIVLCDLQGRTRKEAARQLGWPEGSLSSRLARGRVLLAKRLTRQGLGVSGGALAMVLTERAASAVVPASVVVSTVQAATLVAAGSAAAVGLIPAQVIALTEGVLKTMLLTKLKIVTAVLVLVVGGGAGGLLYPTYAAEGTKADNGANRSMVRDGADRPKHDPQKATDPTEQKLLQELERQLEQATRQLETEAILSQLNQQIRALEAKEAARKQLRDKIRALEDAEATLKRLRERLQALDQEKQVQDQEELKKKDVEEMRQIGRRLTAKHEATTTAVREIKKAMKKLRETTHDKKTEIEALDEIKKAVEQMKSAAQDIKEAEDFLKKEQKKPQSTKELEYWLKDQEKPQKK